MNTVNTSTDAPSPAVRDLVDGAVSPTLAGFRELAATGRRVISVAARLVAEDLTPVGLYAQLCGDRDLTYLFESADAGVWSRWSFVGVNAAATLIERDSKPVWLGTPVEGLTETEDPLAALHEVLRTLHTDPQPGLPPFTSGMVGYLGYDVVRRLETLPDTCVDDLQIPELVMMLASDLAILDHHRGELWLVANAINYDNSDARIDEAYRDARDRLNAMVATLSQPRASLLAVNTEAVEVPVVRQRSDAEFEQVVADVIVEIEAGEAFQVVPSQRFELATEVDAFSIYRALRQTNPSPYLYLLNLPGFQIIGSSPEPLVTVTGDVATTYPIAGTRPRGATPHEDAQLEVELLADEKERAEHLMLVDLGRNDLGRVCVPGTVEVIEFMHVRRYSHVMHLEAAVTGQVQPGRSGLDVVLACFPAGTLSGAPKIRAMEIIDRLEVSRRGLYGGVVGYFDFAGNADTAIAIRTGLLKNNTLYVQAGGGVVADSIPANENIETQNKAAAVLRAARRAAGLTGL